MNSFLEERTPLLKDCIVQGSQNEVTKVVSLCQKRQKKHIQLNINTSKMHQDQYYMHSKYCISVVTRHFFPFQNNPKDLDSSYKTDLDLWNCLGRVKLVIQQNYGIDLVCCNHSREGKTSSYSRINMVM